MRVSRRWMARLSKLCLSEALDRVVQRFGDQPFLHYGDETLTFAEFAERVGAWRRALWGHAFGRGDRAVILAENSPAWCAVYTAIVAVGGAAVPVDTHVQNDHLVGLIEHSGARVVFVSRGTKQAVIDILNRIPQVRWIVSLDDAHERFLWEARDQEAPPCHVDEICTILYTAGTTGEPKGVPLTHRNLMSAAILGLELTQARRDDVVLNPLPLFHVFPLVDGFLTPLLAGMQLVLTAQLARGELRAALERHAVTLFTGVPALYAIIAAQINKSIGDAKGLPGWMLRRLMARRWFTRSPRRLRLLKRLIGRNALGPWARIRLFISGGAPLGDETRRIFNALGLSLMEGYGLTETTAAVSMTAPGRYRAGSVGRPPSRWLDVRIDHPDEDGIGEILLRGPTVMQGYEGKRGTPALTPDGYLRTGDLGYVDKDGYLFITARAKDIIVPATGKNVYPAELEMHYMQSPLIKDICIFGLAQPGSAGEIVHAEVVIADHMLAAGDDVAYERLAAEIHCLSRALPSYKRVRSFNIWKGGFPVVSTGKVRKYAVRESVRRELARHALRVKQVDDANEQVPRAH